ncbi:hypothetical protein DQ384_02390 [Sphaerisporangium album]|uniref:Uncharacterized protein n=1 Tax=Sphaerisporangium album TaxID=509200 RepID=A0A367FS84_9ACTN|nr:hypothetical protein [Sphaerisporangium album]RCG33293.1 hypothetical protein DQ384_02390 [Sphaerisporangium album]
MTNYPCEAPPCHRPASGDARPPALPGLRVCASCRASVRRDLLRLPDLHEACAEALTSGPRAFTERVSGRRPSGISLNEAAVSARADVVAFLACWTALVADERATPGPRSSQVTRLAGFLDQHLDWLLGHPAAGSLAAEIAEVTAAARAALEPRRESRRELGSCGNPGCSLTLYAGSGPGQASEVRCEAGHVWHPREWLLLGRPLDRALLGGVADADPVSAGDAL